MNVPQTDLTWQLLQLSNIIFISLILGFLFLLLRLNALGRRAIGSALVLSVLPALFPIEAWLARPLETNQALGQLPEQIDGIIVLGGSVEWAVTDKQQQLNLNGAGERMLAGASLARRYPNATLVFTGLFKELVPNEFEPAGQKGFFTGPEFANRDIVYIGQARSTYEEALLSVETLDPKPQERWILVTSAWHMPRAIGSFKTQGWTLIPYPVDYRSTEAFKPSVAIVDRLDSLDEVIREWGALMIYNRLGRTETLFPE